MFQSGAQLLLNPSCFQIFRGIKASKNARVSGKECGGAVQRLICIHLMVFSV